VFSQNYRGTSTAVHSRLRIGLFFLFFGLFYGKITVGDAMAKDIFEDSIIRESELEQFTKLPDKKHQEIDMVYTICILRCEYNPI